MDNVYAWQQGSGAYFAGANVRYERWSKDQKGYKPLSEPWWRDSGSLSGKPSESWTPDQFCQAIAVYMGDGYSYTHGTKA
jgi:hypothetical protein